MGGESILLLDGEPQKRLRAMLDPSLRPRVVEATTPDLVEPLAAELLDGLEGRGEAELMSEYFEPISVLGLGRVLGLGHLDGDTLRRWFHGLAEGAINFEDDPAKWEVADATAAEIDLELAPVFERLFADPDGSTIATMLRSPKARSRSASRRSCPTLKVILLGGMQEPGHAAGSTLVGLLESRQVRAVLDDLTLVRDAVEEGLRWVSPIGTQTRRALVDAELGGVTVPAGANLGLSSRRRTATRQCGGRPRTSTTSSGRSAPTPRSASGRTTARVTTSRACRCGSRSRGCSSGCPGCGSTPTGRRSSPAGSSARRGTCTSSGTHDLGRRGGRVAARRERPGGRGRRDAIALARVGGAWHAVETWCTHAECPLSDGWVEGGAIRCACHGSLFDLATGDVLEGPAEEPVRVFPTRVAGDRVEIELRAKAEVGIVGNGVAGYACAVRLAKHGIRPLLIGLGCRSTGRR